MALVARDAGASLDTVTAQKSPQLSGGLYAGQDLDPAAPCYIEADGKVYMFDGTAANNKARLAGFTPRRTLQGEPVTLFGAGARFRYASGGLTPGSLLFGAATPGRLDTAATTGDATGIAQAINDTDIRVTRMI